MFHSTPVTGDKVAWKRLRLSPAGLSLKGEVSNRSLFLMRADLLHRAVERQGETTRNSDFIAILLLSDNDRSPEA
jgi:hypothetical protein